MNLKLIVFGTILFAKYTTALWSFTCKTQCIDLGKSACVDSYGYTVCCSRNCWGYAMCSNQIQYPENFNSRYWLCGNRETVQPRFGIANTLKITPSDEYALLGTVQSWVVMYPNEASTEDQLYVKLNIINNADAYYFVGEYLSDFAYSSVTSGRFTKGLKVNVQYPQRLYLTVVANNPFLYADFVFQAWSLNYYPPVIVMNKTEVLP